jgi:cyanate lyase
MTRAQLTEEILAAKHSRGVSWAELAELLTAPVEWATAALLGQFPLDETQPVPSLKRWAWTKMPFRS